ncbi:MAG: hypothetical protein WC156_14190 [Pedobacter sp.]
MDKLMIYCFGNFFSAVADFYRFGASASQHFAYGLLLFFNIINCPGEECNPVNVTGVRHEYILSLRRSEEQCILC